MNKFIAIMFVCVLSVFGLNGCANSYTETSRTPTGTRSVQSVSNGFSRDTVVHNDSERAYWERCMANRAPQMGNERADRECAAEGTYGPMGGYGGYGYPGGLIVDTYGNQAARLGGQTGVMYVGPTGQPTVGSTGVQQQTLPNEVVDAQAKVLDNQEQRLRRLESAKKRAPKK